MRSVWWRYFGTWIWEGMFLGSYFLYICLYHYYLSHHTFLWCAIMIWLHSMDWTFVARSVLEMGHLCPLISRLQKYWKLNSAFNDVDWLTFDLLFSELSIYWCMPMILLDFAMQRELISNLSTLSSDWSEWQILTDRNWQENSTMICLPWNSPIMIVFIYSDNNILPLSQKQWPTKAI